MATDTTSETLHGGRLIARRLKAHGVEKLFTLSGGHLFSIYDGCREEGIDIVDVRHEQTAAFAAEGWAKVTRTPGVAALTAGPGVTNGMSAMGSALMNHSPIVVLGGRAPALRWGMGSLQEIDHLPFVAPLTLSAKTAETPAAIPGLIDDALAASLGGGTGHGGPAFVDFPLDHVFTEAPDPANPASVPDAAAGPAPDDGELAKAIELLRGAERPAIMAGTDLYWGHGEGALLRLVEQVGIPTYVNGLARGTVPSDHELAFSRTRGQALQGADVALVIGVPLDFRMGFGAAFGEGTKVILIDRVKPERPHPREIAAELYGGLTGILDALADGVGAGASTTAWVEGLRAAETEKLAAEEADLNDGRSPLHPLRLYKELIGVLDRDAIVIGDGGDFVSYAGRVMPTYQPGCWLDPGPFGCLGAGPGYALAAKLAHPDKQVVLLLGDGAFGFSGMEWDTLARHGVNVVGVIGNNGIWALEKHPMEFLYGYSVAAELVPETPYDQVAASLGANGTQVHKPEELRGALEQALSEPGPSVVNVMTDPNVVYPRKANLA